MIEYFFPIDSIFLNKKIYIVGGFGSCGRSARLAEYERFDVIILFLKIESITLSQHIFFPLSGSGWKQLIKDKVEFCVVWRQ